MLRCTMTPMHEAIDRLMARGYPAGACWQYVLDLLYEGGRGDWRRWPAEALTQTREVWFCDDPRDPWSLTEPWDWLLLARKGRPGRGALVGHIGLVVDDTSMTHVRPQGGVCVEPLRRWRPRLIQIARMRPHDEEMGEQ